MKLPADFQKDQSLSKYTTFGIGGKAKYFIEINKIDDMKNVIAFCHSENIPYFIIGKGSNCLFDDRGFDGLVVANRIDFLERPEECVFYAGAGYSFSLLGSQSARQGWSGLEFASGIPASVGGAVFMNAGANGRETCESLESVDFVTNEGKLVRLMRSEIEFSYRHSSFHQRQGAIVAASFRLTPSDTAREKQLGIIDYRIKTQPYKDKSAGCVFRNPGNGIAAGALIDQSGLKGKSIGGAQVSLMHANFLVNTGTATAHDILTLIDVIKKEVKAKTGYDLENEVRCVPYSLQDHTINGKI
ncbi:MAG: UDP-N-acetylmuramate dehydrogenase [Parachlamydiaceae bacterium]|nr:UDP-N-acetylmuramate dehydrogenase [Parachlamydiaceae bacterium]